MRLNTPHSDAGTHISDHFPYVEGTDWSAVGPDPVYSPDGLELVAVYNLLQEFISTREGLRARLVGLRLLQDL